MPTDMSSREMLACVRDCSECASFCEQTSRHCMRMGGSHAGVEHQRLLQDCRQICSLAIDFMARASSYTGHVCRECAEIATACADDCTRLAGSDSLMLQCAAACRQCARSCEKMAAAFV